MTGRPAIDLSARRFGRLVVVQRAPNNGVAAALWLVRCDCGNEKVVRGIDLNAGKTKSCGCLHRETSSATGKACATHGMFGTPTYQKYHDAKRRCENPRTASYANYGGRGLEFRFKGFEEFLAHLGECPEGCQLDRMDNDGHYEVGNVRWATPLEQQNNKSTNRIATFEGRKGTVAELSRVLGIDPGLVRSRLESGWHPDWAFEVPSGMTPEEWWQS